MKIIRFLDLDQLNYCQGNIKIEQVLENLGKVIISYDSVKDRVLAPARENETENDRENFFQSLIEGLQKENADLKAKLTEQKNRNFALVGENTRLKKAYENAKKKVEL